MTAQRHDELRLGLLDHRPVVGVGRAAVLRGPLRGDAGSGRVNAENIDLLACRIRR